jgi:hypothetical protein
MQWSVLIESIILVLAVSLGFGFINEFYESIEFTLMSFGWYLLLAVIGHVISILYLNLLPDIPKKFKYLVHIISVFFVLLVAVVLNVSSVIVSGDLCLVCAFYLTIINKSMSVKVVITS